MTTVDPRQQDMFWVESACFEGKSPRVVAFRGAEALSEPYLFVIHVALPQVGAFDLETAVGERISLASKPRPDEPNSYAFYGIISTIELLQQEKDTALFEISMVPSLWRLSQSLHSRVFTDMSVPEIMEAVFADNNLSPAPDRLDYRFALNASYPKREHVCQYHESDLAFVSRWMEREGIYYFFEHDDEIGHERIVFCDERYRHASLRGSAVRYRPGGDADTTTSSDAFFGFRSAASMRPKAVKLTDYDYLRPALAVEGEADAYASGSAAVVDHRYNFLTPADGARLAKIRAEELMARQRVFTGHGGITHMRVGYTFRVEEHPSPRCNDTYLTTSIRHHHWAGNEGWRPLIDVLYEDEYRVDVIAIPKSVPFRPVRATPHPRIYGVETALVDGPKESLYAQIDAHGRYKVKIQFDESALANGTASTWVRMLQPHGGAIEGFHFPLRKGTEVMLLFLGGDPDRPMIAGVVPNTVKPSPVIDANLTQNVIQTGSRNRIEIEDLEGKQYIDHSTPPMNTFTHMGEPHAAHTHYFHKHTDGNELIEIGTDRHIVVGANQTIDVGGDQTEHVVGDVSETYDKNHTIAIAIDETIDVGGVHTETVQGDVTQTFKSNETKDITLNQTLTVGGDQTETVTGNKTLSTTGNHVETVTGTYTLNVTAPATETAEADWFTTIKGNSGSLTIGMTTGTFVGLRNLNFIGGQLTTTIGNTTAINMGLTETLNLGTANLTLALGAEANFKISAVADFKLAATFEYSGAVSLKYANALAWEYTKGAKYGITATLDYTKKVMTVAQGQITAANHSVMAEAAQMRFFR